jgi:6-phosphofructokinase 1
MQTRLVNVDAESYECARRYMIRLAQEDFDDPESLKKLAATVNLAPEQFRKRFGYVAGVSC